MAHYLITGIGGSGKSKVCELLNEQGHFALDSDDVPGLCSWTKRETGEIINVDYTKFVDYSKVAWTWNEEALRELLAAHKDVYLCGSSSNEFDFFDLFDATFILSLSDATHEERLKNRESEYGKDPQTMAWLLAERASFIKQAIDLGATAIDANETPESTVSRIIELS